MKRGPKGRAYDWYGNPASGKPRVHAHVQMSRPVIMAIGRSTLSTTGKEPSHSPT